MKLIFKVTLCVIQFVCLYRVLRHENYYLIPLQVLIAIISMLI